MTHVYLPVLLLMAAAAALYWPTLSLDFHLLDEPGDTVYSFKMVEKLVAEPSLKNLVAEKDVYRLTPVHYFYHYALSKVLGFNGPRHHAAHLCWLLLHMVLLVWLFRSVTGTGWWAGIAAFFYLLFIPDDWNSTPYNFYTLFTLEPLVIAFVGLWCGIAAWLVHYSRNAHSPRVRRNSLLIAVALLPLALLALFTKETAIFYAPGVAVLGYVLWRRTHNTRFSLWIVAAYALACAAFLGCYFYATHWDNRLTKEVMPGDTTAARTVRIIHAFTSTFGPLLLVPLITYVLVWLARKRGGLNGDLFRDLDIVAVALALPSLVQLALWPNFQIRLLLPHGFLLSCVLGLSLWRLAILGRASALPRVSRILSRAVIGAAVICAVPYALFAAMSLHNFRLLLRCNELSRVAAYKKCRGLLEPNSRLFVAIMRGDQVFYEIGWRLQFFDQLSNPVIELQPGSEQPRPADVVYYHARMARVKPPTAPAEIYRFDERGRAFLNVGWGKALSALAHGTSILQSAEGGNEYVVYKLRATSAHE